MSENLHDIDKLFKDNLDEHEEMPSGKVWDAIDTNLDKSNIIQIKRKYNNLKRLAIALLLILSATIIYEIKTKNLLKEELAKNTSEENTGNKSKDKTASVKEKDKKNTITSTDGQATLDNNKQTNNAAIKEQDITAQQNEKNAGKEKLNSPQQKTITNSIQLTDKTVATENAADNFTAKSRNQSSTKQRTKITIRNGGVAEDVNENVAVNNNDDNNTFLPFPGALTCIQNKSAEKINNVVTKIDFFSNEQKRLSPDVVVNKITKAKTVKPFHISVMPFYAPQFAFNHIEDDNQNTSAPPPPRPGTGSWREEIRQQEQHQTASSFGVLVEVPVTKKWSVQSGVTLLTKKIAIDPKKIYAKLENDGKIKYRFDCSSGYTYINDKTGTTAVGDSISTISSSNTLRYVGIPLAISYSVPVGKFNIKPTVGAAINLLTRQKIETELVKGGTKETQTFNEIHGLKPNYFTATTGVAVDYTINKKMAVNITPSASFALSSITKNAIVRSYPNTFGVSAGVKFNF